MKSGGIVFIKKTCPVLIRWVLSSTWVSILVCKHQRCRFIWHSPRCGPLDPQERVQGRDNNKIMKLQMHFTTKLWDALLSDQRNPACDDLGNWAILCPSCSSWRDTLRLKICRMLRRLLSSDGKEERHYKVKSARTSFEKNNSTRRQDNFMLSIATAYELRSDIKIHTI